MRELQIIPATHFAPRFAFFARRAMLFVVIMIATFSQPVRAQPVITDTVWFRTNLQIGLEEIRGCAMGGIPLQMVICDNTVTGDRLHEIDLETGAITATINTGHTIQVWDMAMASNANVVVTADLSGELRIWRWPEKTLVRVINDHGGAEPHVAITSDGKRVFNSNSGHLFDVETGDTLWTFPIQGGSRCKPVMTPDDRLLITALNTYGPNGPASAALLIDVATGAWIGTFPGTITGSIGIVTACSLSDDGRFVAVFRDQDRSTLTVYDRQTETIVMDTTFEQTITANFIAFDPTNSGFLFNCFVYPPGIPQRDAVYFHMGDWRPTHIVMYGASFHSPDWRYYYGCSQGGVWLSRADLTPMSAPIDEASQHVTIVPHPAGTTFEMRQVPAPDGPVIVEVSSMDGRSLLHEEAFLAEGAVHVSVSSIAPGTFTLRLVRDAQVLCSTMITIR